MSASFEYPNFCHLTFMLSQNDTNKTRTAVYVLTVTEELETWEESKNGLCLTTTRRGFCVCALYTL